MFNNWYVYSKGGFISMTIHSDSLKCIIIKLFEKFRVDSTGVNGVRSQLP